MDKDALAAVLPVEAAGGIAEEHDGELKPLGLMHGHDLHGGAEAAAGGGLLPLFGKAAQPEHIAVHSAVAGGFKALGQADERHEVCAALRTVAHGGAEGEHVQLLNDAPSELGGAEVSGGSAQRVKAPDKIAALFVILRGGKQGGVEIRLFIGAADIGQLIRAEAQ